MPDRTNILFLGKDYMWFEALKKVLPGNIIINHVLPEEIKQEIKKQEYTLIVIDTMDLPEKEIISRVEYLKKKQENARIVIASASPTWRAVREAFKAGADDYIAKTFNPDNLVKNLMPYL